MSVINRGSYYNIESQVVTRIKLIAGSQLIEKFR